MAYYKILAQKLNVQNSPKSSVYYKENALIVSHLFVANIYLPCVENCLNVYSKYNEINCFIIFLYYLF